jgi:hypothetical protein
MRRAIVLVATTVLLFTLAVSGAQALAVAGLVSVDSPIGNHPQNAQNEPALAIDPARPNILAAGSNDLVDMQPCSRQASTTAGPARSRSAPSTSE